MNDLQTIVRLNEKVKQVVALSNSVFIVGLNAMFQARRAKALGFNTVTSELRKFSSDISDAMATLKRSIEFQIEFIARNQPKRHLAHLVSRINQNAVATRSAAFVEKMQINLEMSSDKLYLEFYDYIQDFMRALDKAERASETGHSLFVHAKVEAQSAGDKMHYLLPVVEQIESSITKLDTLLGEIRSLTTQLSFKSSHRTIHIAA